MSDHTFQAGTQASSRSIDSPTRTTEQHWLLEAVQSSQPALDPALMALPLGLIAVWAVVIAYVRQWQKRRNDDSGRSAIVRHRRRDQLPCHSCAFFTNSAYLKCTVNPVDALTQKAIGCTDYAPNLPSLQQKGKG